MQKTLILLLILISAGLQATGFKSGDKQMDHHLINIGHEAQLDFDAFLSKTAQKFGQEKDFLKSLHVDFEWSAGDIYFAAVLAQIVNKPMVELIDVYNHHRAQGWGKIAQELGIQPFLWRRQ